MYDLIIIGGGAAGLSAANTALEGGVKSILVLEALQEIGGNAAMAGGMIYALDTPLLENSGLNDAKAELAEALYFHHYDLIEPGLLRKWFEETKHTIAWLESRGVEFVMCGQGEGYTHIMADSPGVAWFHRVRRPLAAELKERGVEIRTKEPVAEILTDDSDRVCGVRTKRKDGSEEVYEARSVLLTCGGFMNNIPLLKKYFPLYYTEDSFYQIVPAPGNGIALAESAGAKVNLECSLVKETGMCFKPGPGAPGRIFAMDGSVYINKKGRRIVDESLWNRNYAANAMLLQPDKAVYTIYSSETLDAALSAKEPFDLASEKEAYMQYIQASAAEGKVCRFFDTLAALAAWIGADPAVLTQTIEEYNGFCEAGEDLAFRKPARCLLPLRSAPYLAIRIKPMYIDTIGPVVTDDCLHVLGTDADPIPGFYAAGVITAGWEGRDYMRFGSALSYSLTSGRMVGRTIAEELQSRCACRK